MLYVQQSLGPGEEILTTASYHWMYTVRAVLCILIGVALGVALGYGVIWWMVTAEIRDTYPDLPPEMYAKAWHHIIASHGGYKQILWSLNPLIRFSMLGCFVIGIFLYVHLMIVKATTEIAVTTERVIYKKGLIARHVGEVGIDRIEGVSVNQGVFGRIWGYGDVIIRGMGLGELILPELINEPVLFRKVIQEAKTLRDKVKMSSKAQPEDF